jgi:hypothetical protein
MVKRRLPSISLEFGEEDTEWRQASGGDEAMTYDVHNRSTIRTFSLEHTNSNTRCIYVWDLFAFCYVPHRRRGCLPCSQRGRQLF